MLSPVLYHVTSCNVTCMRACLVFQGTLLLREWCSLSLQVSYFVYLHVLAWSRRAWRGRDSLPVIQKACLKSWAIAPSSHPWVYTLCCTGMPAARKCGSLGLGQARHSWMQRQTSCPPLYHSYLSCRLFLRRGVGTAAHRLLQRSPDPPPPGSGVAAVGSCRLPPSGYESRQLH